MSDALAQVKNDLGRGAVILHTRTIKRGGIFGVGARSMIEITATTDPRVIAARKAAGARSSVTPARSHVGSMNQQNAEPGTVAETPHAAPLPLPADRRVAAYVEQSSGGVKQTEAADTHGASPGLRGGVSDRGVRFEPPMQQDSVVMPPSDRGLRGLATPSEGSDVRVGAVEPEPIAPAAKKAGSSSSGDAHATAPASDVVNQADPEVRRELRQIRTLMNSLLRKTGRSEHPETPAELVDYYTQLVSEDVAEDLAIEILDKVQARLSENRQTGGASYWDECGRLVSGRQNVDQNSVHDELRKCIAEMVPPSEPLSLEATDRPAVVALVGPTGVGKTTTIAKLAANMKLREGKQVGLITIDTYRIAAVEQLKTYAQILKVPLISVLTPSDMRDAIRQMSDVDLILIDTAGRSQKDELRIAELSEFIAAAQPDETHLVLSSTSREETIREAVSGFSTLGAKHVIFTKLDEAVGFGIILNVLRTVDMSLSYLTNGQSVPDDIEVGNPDLIARLVLGDSKKDSAVFQPLNVAASGKEAC